MANIIWDRSGNPSKYVSDELGIPHWHLGAAIHEIKHAGNVRAPDRVIIYDIIGGHFFLTEWMKIGSYWLSARE